MVREEGHRCRLIFIESKLISEEVREHQEEHWFFLTNVGKGRAISFELKVGFRNVNGSKVHYANAVIGGRSYFWNIPEANRGTQSGIRYGAYRVKGGKARIQWANTNFRRINK